MMTSDNASPEYHFSGYRLDPRHRRLTGPDGAPVTLSARPFDVLLTLVEQNGTVVTREQLMNAVWPRLVVEEHTLTQAISIVRKALSDASCDSHFIRTLPGHGYCFIAPVELRAARQQRTPDGSAPRTRWRPALAAFIATSFVTVTTLVVLASGFAPDAARAPRIASAQASIGTTADAAARVDDSLAVLPFAVLGEEHESTFATGLHDALVDQLAQMHGLKVMSRNSVASLHAQGLAPREFGRVLGVESLLAATLRYTDAQARISLQLVDARSGFTRWSSIYDANLQDAAAMLALEGDIASKVAAALRQELPAHPQLDDFTSLPPEMVAPWRYNLAGQRAHAKQDYAEEWHLARKALELNADFYEALYTFTSVNVVLIARPLPGMTSRDHAELALAHAQRMIELAPERSEGHALKARMLAANRDWAGAAAEINELLALGADLSSLEFAAPTLLALGEFERAVAIYEANLATELLNPFGRGNLLAALELAGRRDDARREFRLGEELHGEWWGDSVQALLAPGRHEQIAGVEELAGTSPMLRQALLDADDASAVRAAISAYRARPMQHPLEARFFAALAAKLGEHDLAIDLLRISMRAGSSGIFWAWLPVFDDTRRHARFRDLLRETGLVAYWESHGWPKMCQPVESDFSCDWRAYPAAVLTSSQP